MQINLWTLESIPDRICRPANLFLMVTWEKAVTTPAAENRPKAHVNKHLPSPRLTLLGLVVQLSLELGQPTAGVSGAWNQQRVSHTESSTWDCKEQVSGTSGFDHYSTTRSLCPSCGFHEQLQSLRLCAPSQGPMSCSNARRTTGLQV